MRVVLRADAGYEQGTGHVMRCLTLAGELIHRGHDVHLFTALIPVGWLEDAVRTSGVVLHTARAHELALGDLRGLDADWLVVDSYRIDPECIADADDELPVLAIVDGDDRGIRASLYLDQNLGADAVPRESGAAARWLAGADFTLIRRAVLDARREHPWIYRGERPQVLSFMGGTDPTASITGVVAALTGLGRDIELTVVAPDYHHAAIEQAAKGMTALRVLGPVSELPELLAAADIVVSAAGTSAWDICALGVPAVLVAAVDNQQVSLEQAVDRGLALGVDAVAAGEDTLREVGSQVARLLDDDGLRQRLSRTSRATFDGLGASRVASRMEQAVRGVDKAGR